MGGKLISEAQCFFLFFIFFKGMHATFDTLLP